MKWEFAIQKKRKLLNRFAICNIIISKKYNILRLAACMIKRRAAHSAALKRRIEGKMGHLLFRHIPAHKKRPNPKSGGFYCPFSLASFQKRAEGSGSDFLL